MKEKNVILKLSGKVLENFCSDETWAQRIKDIKDSCDGLIIVHGAGTAISEWSEKLNCNVEFINGQRVTTPKIMDVVTAVQSGLLNHKVIAYLQANGLDSIGLSGIDMGLFVADNLKPELGRVGFPRAVGSPKWLHSLLSANAIPVFSSVCRDEDGNLMNVNADVFAECLAECIGAGSVLFLSDVAGVKLNGKVQHLLNSPIINSGIAGGEITGGMIPKLESCMKLLNNGVRKIWIGSENAFADTNTFSFNNLFGTWIINEQA
ncbi:MAG: acetylglutamate kinase [Bacteroidota bacterium]|nr:acetylglutamate kinase [Bacteroidota bacterium]